MADIVLTEEIPNIKQNEDFHVVDELGTYYIVFNVNSDLFSGKTADQANAMRKAISFLIDRQSIVDHIGLNEQKAATSFIPAIMADGNGGIFKMNSADYSYPYAETEGYYPFSPYGVEEETIQKAREMLAYAGYQFDADGRLSKETPIKITYLINESTGHKAVAESIKANLSILGIQVDICDYNWSQFIDERKTGNFTIAREGWLADYNDPINMLEIFTLESPYNDAQLGRNGSN